MSPSAPDQYYIQLLTNIPIYANRYISPILFVIGNLGNLICFSILLKKPWRKNVCAFYFLIYLLTNIIYVNSTLFGSIMTLGLNIQLQNSNSFLCKAFFFSAYLFSLYPPVLLILASIDRLLISSQNVDTRLYSSKRLAYLLMSISFFLCFTFSLHILIKVHIQEMYPTIFICYYDLSKSYQDFIFYSTIILAFLPPLILLILSILSFKNVHHLRAIPRDKRDRIRQMTKRDFQLLRCLYTHDITYILSIILVDVGAIYGTINPAYSRTPNEEALYNFLNSFGAFIHFISRCSSVFIFISTSKAFRQEFKRMIYKICCRNIPIVQEENQVQEHIEINNVHVHTVDLQN